MTTVGAGILMIGFDKNLFLLNATGFQYAVEIFRRCGQSKQALNGTLLVVPGWRNW